MIDANAPNNSHRAPIPVRHADLQRVDDSAYRSACPECKEGVLLVYRDADMKLSRDDRCIRCGQAFRYTDEGVGVEGFAEKEDET